MAFLTRLLTNRILLKAIWVIWIALPYPVRKRVTTEGIRVLLVLKRAIGIFRQVELTPPGKIFTLSFWGDPHLDSEQFNLTTVEGRVARSLSISFGALKTYPVVDRQITMDCVGGLRNNMTMRECPWRHCWNRQYQDPPPTPPSSIAPTATSPPILWRT